MEDICEGKQLMIMPGNFKGRGLTYEAFISHLLDANVNFVRAQEKLLICS